MKIDFKEIKIKNFLSYGNKETVFNLSKNPFTIIIGENGTGKSSICVEAIHFALFGKTLRRVKKDEICNNINKKNCQVSLSFRYNDKYDFLIERGLYPDYIKMTNITTDTILDSKSSKKLIQEEIEKILGFDQNTLKNICILSLNNSKSFVDLTAEETRNVIENLLGIQVFSTMLEEIKKDIKYEKDILETTKKDITLYKSLLDEQKEKLRRYEIFKRNFENEKLGKIKGLKEEVVLRTLLLKKNENSLSLIIPDDEPIAPILPTNLPLDTSKIDNEIAIINQLMNKVSNDNKLKELTEEHKLYTDKVTVDIRVLENSINEYKGKISIQEEKIKQADKEIKKIKVDIDYFNTTDYCPICKRDLNQEHKDLEIKKLNSEIEKLEDTKKEINDKIKLVQGLILNLNNSLFVKDTDRIDINEKYEEQVKIINDNIQKNLTKLEEKLEEKQIQKNKIVEEYNTVTKNCTDIYNKLYDDYTKKVKERQAKLDEISSISNIVERLKEEIKRIEEQISDIEKDTLDKHIEELVDVNKVKEYELKYNSLVDIYTENEDKLKYHELMKSILSDSGVKANIIAKDIPFINDSINYYLNLLGKNFGIKFNEEFEIELTSYNKKNLSYSNLSEGEKKRTDLAILFSFIDLTRRKNSVNCNILVLDEAMDTSLDKEGQKQVITILKEKIKNDIIKNIFIITHNRNLAIEDAEKIEIINEGGFSKIVEVI